jgi:hypothetical protein
LPEIGSRADRFEALVRDTGAALTFSFSNELDQEFCGRIRKALGNGVENGDRSILQSFPGAERCDDVGVLEAGVDGSGSNVETASVD